MADSDYFFERLSMGCVTESFKVEYGVVFQKVPRLSIGCVSEIPKVEYRLCVRNRGFILLTENKGCLEAPANNSKVTNTETLIC